MPEAAPAFQFVADKGDARLRLDLILVRRVTTVSRLSRNVAQRWIESGAVSVNGRPALRPSARVPEGAAIDVMIPASATWRVRPAAEPAALEILHEDDALLVVNKAAGVVVHPSYKQLSGTLLNAVLWRLRDREVVKPGIVTRLDKDTSGLVLVALRADVHRVMQHDAAAGRIRKTYLAVVRGWPRPRAGCLRFPLGRDPGDRRRMKVDTGGAASATEYEVAAEWDGPAGREALVRCELITGRTHQIRVHLASAGWPIVGDRTYGTADTRISRQALHAHRVSLPHPLTREPLDFEAPIPPEMQSGVFER
jgi:23S rRNA pseudouridine1911/1915/1917 synthase